MELSVCQGCGRVWSDVLYCVLRLCSVGLPIVWYSSEGFQFILRCHFYPTENHFGRFRLCCHWASQSSLRTNLLLVLRVLRLLRIVGELFWIVFMKKRSFCQVHCNKKGTVIKYAIYNRWQQLTGSKESMVFPIAIIIHQCWTNLTASKVGDGPPIDFF